MARGRARRLTAFALPEQENLNRPSIPLEGDLVLLYLLVDGVANGLGARFLSLPSRPFLLSFTFAGTGFRYERVWGGHGGGHGEAPWRREVCLTTEVRSPCVAGSSLSICQTARGMGQ